MLKGLFGKRPVTKADVVLAAGAAVMAVWKAFDTYNEFKTEKAAKELPPIEEENTQ